jgi:uncharacterized protein YjbI with pentapeptide repeats
MMDDIRRCYSLLGLDPSASSDEIKQAWRDLAQVWHPDRFAGNDRLQQKAQEKLKEINQAYEKLRNSSTGAAPRPASPAAAGGYDYPSDEEPDVDPVEILKQGVNTWNLWRKKYSNVRPRLRTADLNGMYLEGYDLREVDLSNATLQDCDLYKANLSGAKAVAARLQRSHLSRALLLGADLSLADLTDTDLSGANLSGAKFADCRMFGAKMVGANLCGADLSTVIGLSPVQVAHISTDRSTKFPEYLKGVSLEAGRRA